MSEQKSYQRVIVNGETVVDFAKADLSYYDVTTGKPFYNSQGQLEIGELKDSTESFKKSIESSSVDIVVIPENTLKVRANCFSDSSVSKVILPEGLSSVGTNAFKNTSTWSGGQKLRTNKTLTEIQSNAFNFSKLTGGVFLPSTLNNVSSNIFGTSTSSSFVIFSDLPEKPVSWATDWNAQNRPVVWNYPENTRGTDNKIYIVIDNIIYEMLSETARSVTVLGLLEEPASSELVIPDCITIEGTTRYVSGIATSAFAYESKLEKIVFGSEILSIGDDIFYGCKNLKELDLSRCMGLSDLKDVLTQTSVLSIILPPSLQKIPTGFSRKLTELYNLTNFEITTANLGYGSSVVIHTDINTPSIIEQFGDFVFANHSDGYVLVDYRGKADNVTFPKTYKNTTYRIGPWAFCDNPIIKKIRIPSSITSVEFGAFSACPNLLEVYFEDGLTEIGSWAFASCEKLKTLRLPETLLTISDSFYGCKGLITLKIPDSVQSLEETAAFANCEALRSVDLGKNLRNLPDGTFANCTVLSNIKLSQNMSEVGSQAFYGCTSIDNFEVHEGNPYLKAIDGNLYSKDETTFVMYAPGKKDVRVQLINPNVTKIGKGAFDCHKFACVVELPPNTQIIEERAFADAVHLGHVTCPDGLLEVGDYAFAQCYELEVVNLGNSLISLGAYAFNGDSALIMVKIPDTISQIGEYAFLGTGLDNSYNVANGIYYLGNDTNPYVVAYQVENTTAFALTLQEDTRVVCDRCFSGSSVVELTIPDSVRYVTGAAFTGNSNITINMSEDHPYLCLENGVLYNKDKTTLLKVTAAFTSNSFIIPSTVTSVSPFAFYKSANLQYLDVSNQVTYLGKYCFSNCAKLTHVTFNDPTVAIPANAFSSDTALILVDFGNNITAIGDPKDPGDVFWGCTSFTEWIVPASVQYLDGSTLISTHTVYMKSEVPCQVSNVWSSNPTVQNIYVPTAAAVTAYKNASNWSNYAAKIKQGVPA